MGRPRGIRSTRQPVYDGEVAYVPLTRGKFAVVDREDAGSVCRWNWTAEPKGRTWYAKRAATADEREAGIPSKIYLHMAVFVPGPGKMTDHRDGDGLNCRRKNLREATGSQNQMNSRGKERDLPKGVYPRGARYFSCIKIGDRQEPLGVFETIDEARAAYAAAAAAVFGEFARAA